MNLYRRAFEVFRKNIVFYIILGILCQLCSIISLKWLSHLTYANFDVWKSLFIIVISPLPDFILLIITCHIWHGEKVQISDLKTLWISIPGIILFTAFLVLLNIFDPTKYQSFFINRSAFVIAKFIFSVLIALSRLTSDLYFTKKANNEKSAFHHALKLVLHHPLVTIGTFIKIFWSFIIIIVIIFYKLASLNNPNAVMILTFVASPIYSAIYAYFLIEWSMRLNNRFESN